MTTLRQKSQSDKKVSLLLILICSLWFSGCNPKETSYTNPESKTIDSLIKLQYVNDRTLIVKFGYDALTAINTTEGIVVVDAGISTLLTERYLKLVEKDFNQKKFIYVINTHGHHDHIRGNSVFHDAQIIGHESCKNDAIEIENTDSTLKKTGGIVSQYDQQLRQLSPGTREWEENFTQKIRYAGAYRDISMNLPFRFPDITFTDSLNLKCGDVTFEMIYFGRFHSHSDILIYAPETGTLFTGDLFSKYGRPGINNSSITDAEKWNRALKWIRSRTNNLDTIIDGHGEVLSNDDLKQFADNLLSKYPDIMIK